MEKAAMQIRPREMTGMTTSKRPPSSLPKKKFIIYSYGFITKHAFPFFINFSK